MSSRGLDPRSVRAVLGFDPLSLAMTTGDFGSSLDRHLAQAVEWATRMSDLQGSIRTLSVSGLVTHGAGGSDAQELAAVLASGVYYLRELTGAGLSAREALAQMELRLALSADQFGGIAKLRAARRLWGRLAQVVGVEGPESVPPIHAVTSPAMLSVYDPWVNLLRTMVAAFAGGTGGADAVTVLPYDYFSVGHHSTVRGRRLARNIHALLIDEAQVNRIVDPAGGSWYVEWLTNALAREAWKIFQAVEAAGGLRQALTEGTWKAQVDATWDCRAGRLASGADPLTGVSEFPNGDEVITDPDVLEALRPAAGGPGMAFRRWPQIFETQRARADRHLAASGRRPSVLLVTLGTQARFSARLNFATNFFAAAGIESVTPPSGEIETWSQALEGQSAGLVCICSDDSTYQDEAAATARLLKERGATTVYLAGPPGAHGEDWIRAGVDVFIYQGVDKLAVLKGALDAAGVA